MTDYSEMVNELRDDAEDWNADGPMWPGEQFNRAATPNGGAA